MAYNTNNKSNIDLSKIDKEKAKLFFTMLGEVVAMILGLFQVFKKDEKKNENSSVSSNS